MLSNFTLHNLVRGLLELSAALLAKKKHFTEIWYFNVEQYEKRRMSQIHTRLKVTNKGLGKTALLL